MIDEEYLIKINSFLIFAALVGLVVIGVLIHNISSVNDNINNEINNIDSKMPKCPKCDLKCPEPMGCPDCPKCPKCPNLPECPKCDNLQKQMEEIQENQVNIQNLNNDQNIPKQNEKQPIKCPECPTKCQVTKCPSVDDIVKGIFPGRNPKVVEGDKFYDINASNSYDGLSTSNYYKQNYKFPMDKIMKPELPLKNYNIQGESKINNSIENNYVSYSQHSKKMKDPVPSNTSDHNFLQSFLDIFPSSNKKTEKVEKKDNKKDDKKDDQKDDKNKL